MIELLPALGTGDFRWRQTIGYLRPRGEAGVRLSETLVYAKVPV